LIQQSLWQINAIKLGGAACLVYLGVKVLRAKPSGALAENTEAPLSDGATLHTGF
jgi:threonine/homoserine/homoserine lactone efflux protein